MGGADIFIWAYTMFRSNLYEVSDISDIIILKTQIEAQSLHWSKGTVGIHLILLCVNNFRASYHPHGFYLEEGHTEALLNELHLNGHIFQYYLQTKITN